jgi:hypothetical protein
MTMISEIHLVVNCNLFIIPVVTQEPGLYGVLQHVPVLHGLGFHRTRQASPPYIGVLHKSHGCGIC